MEERPYLPLDPQALRGKRLKGENSFISSAGLDVAPRPAKQVGVNGMKRAERS